jgi:hypothetical protein
MRTLSLSICLDCHSRRQIVTLSSSVGRICAVVPTEGSKDMSLNFEEERQVKILDSMIQFALAGFNLMALLNGGAAAALLA